MPEMGAGYGSEYWLDRYLSTPLDAAVREATGAEAVEWLRIPTDSPRSANGREWVGLDFLEPNHPALAAWTEFWPQRGSAQNWDAVGRMRRGGETSWLLAEAKAHVEEIDSSCKASEKGGRSQIERAFAEVKTSLGVRESADWLNGYYQYCNRVASLWFLRSRGIGAHLLFVYFTGDRFPVRHSFVCPVDQDGWMDALAEQDKHVGLPAAHPLAPYIHKLFLPVGTFNVVN